MKKLLEGQEPYNLWGVAFSEVYKLMVWAGCYAVLASFFLCIWASAQSGVDIPSQSLLPDEARQIIVLGSKLLATAASSDFCITAALHTMPLAADPFPAPVHDSYHLLDEVFPKLQAMRIINFFTVVLICASLMKRLWA
ncbi:hypothetical protein WJX74_008323 [Apatococcus lobatus]|uniref:Uncharacterized protein n=1 Tax=Apatococcus lobatus TaxID=904363 RepID=A0AAW1RQ83_9CHLO